MADKDDTQGKPPRNRTASGSGTRTRARKPATVPEAAQPEVAAAAEKPARKPRASSAASRAKAGEKAAATRGAAAAKAPAAVAKTAARSAASQPAAAKAPTTKAAATKPAGAAAKAKTGARNAGARARSPERIDTRTTTHRKPGRVAKTAEVSPADAAPLPLSSAGPVAEAGARGEVPPQGEPAIGAPPSQRSVEFMEAAFGAQSRLPEQLAQNIERIESLTQRLVNALALRRPKNPGVEAPGADLFTTAATAWVKLVAEQPERVLGQQVSYWGETLRHFAEAQAALASGTLRAPPEEGERDRRFSNPLWESHPFFNFIKRQYQINAEAMRQAASDLDISSMADRRRVEWFTRQMIDMMSPTNFLATNPDALERAVATEGESLVKGLENLVRDVEQHGGEMIVSLADRDAFNVGEDIGTTEGTVVARTPLYELIQYKPTTGDVHEIPLVIFPPWINKFYILDLKPQNSLIKWIVDQGYTLFVVAWKNPDPSYGETGMDDYVSCYLEVMDRVLDLTDQSKLNVVGYCIAGTTLALTLSLLKQRGDDRVNSATFFTTLTDFSDQGEFTAFLQEDFVSGIEQEAERTGVLSSQLMTRTFSFLRANDLIWGPAIRSYMMGERPPAFDLLFWNGDGTNLPRRMALEYLRGLCQQNRFVSDGFELFGHTLNVKEVTVPLCAIACESDHIAPARDSWRGVSLMGAADKTFILSQSGHIAGIINPPGKKKYGHYVSDGGFDRGYEGWRDQSSFREGSWWPTWAEWLRPRAGGLVPARDPGDGFGPAPGKYVHERA